MAQDTYEAELRTLQTALVRTQMAAMESGEKILVVLEGRDAAGKDGVIARITEHLAPRNTRVVALPKPTDRQVTQWYFQRYVPHFPAAGELVIFNRSWYNRAGVERVMNFCTPTQLEQFLRDAPEFERMLLEADVKLVKYWLDISKKEQAVRLDARRTDPLKALKVSSLDAEAQKRWKDYTVARDDMLMRTHTAWAPWVCVRNNHKKRGRLNLIRHLLHATAPEKVRKDISPPDPAVVFAFEPSCLTDGRLER
ncbi:MAG TPA: polyphosphate kinase 2 [Caulobacteraceae bacterium]|jgi:polyphosphate kinase 2|nr:polyphosphate kinase 2 [Caulobacteraceae bacterium]